METSYPLSQFSKQALLKPKTYCFEAQNNRFFITGNMSFVIALYSVVYGSASFVALFA